VEEVLEVLGVVVVEVVVVEAVVGGTAVVVVVVVLGLLVTVEEVVVLAGGAEAGGGRGGGTLAEIRFPAAVRFGLAWCFFEWRILRRRPCALCLRAAWCALRRSPVAVRFAAVARVPKASACPQQSSTAATARRRKHFIVDPNLPIGP